MWYSGHDGSHIRIGYATSSDGINWTKHGIVLDLGASGEWDDYYVSCPCVIKDDDGTYKMWYSGHDGSHIRIGYAIILLPKANILANKAHMRGVIEAKLGSVDMCGSYKNLLHCDIIGKIGEYTKATLGCYKSIGDYYESFNPIDDFSATVDSTDTTKITISGDKTYAIKKNCRLFFRDSTNNKAGTLRVKTISYDSGNDQTVITTTVEHEDSMTAGASVNVSTCIASGQAGAVSEGNQVYMFKLSRKPKDSKVKVLIRKKDGSWFAYNSFEDVSVYQSTDIQSFINNTGSMDEEVQFNDYLNWLAINISKIYSTLGYSDEEDFKQNTVIEVYYTTKANPLKLDLGWHRGSVVTVFNSINFTGFGNVDGFMVEGYWIIGKKSEVTRSASSGAGYHYSEWTPIKEFYSWDRVYYPGYQVIKADFPTQVDGKEFGLAVLPVLLKKSGKLYLNLHYNEVLYDYETNMKGWEGALLVADYETTSVDANGNTFIAGQKTLELPYFVWNEDED